MSHDEILTAFENVLTGLSGHYPVLRAALSNPYYLDEYYRARLQVDENYFMDFEQGSLMVDFHEWECDRMVEALPPVLFS